jgi:hypothetical protein
MHIPKFTAQASLYRTSNRYRSLGHEGGPQRADLIPQLGGKGFKGYNGCVMDCLDRHPDWTSARCRRSCNDLGIAGTSSDSWVNDLLSSGGISAWEVGCGVMTGSPMACGWVADEMRRQS